MPGMIDLHVHLSVLENFTLNHEVFTRENVEDELLTYASYGVTTVMAQGTDKDLIFDLIREQRSGLPNVARVYTAGQGIVFQNGYGGVVGINNPVSTTDEVIRAVQEQSRKGVDVIKLWVDDEFGTMALMPAEISEAAIATAHAENLRVVAHIFKLEDAKKLAAQGVDGFVNGVRDQDIDQEFLDLMLENELWQVSSTLSREAAMFAYAQRAPFLDDPFFTRSVPESILQRLASPAHHESVISGPHYSQFPGILANSMSNLKHVADAGVRFAFGTDSGPPGRFPGYSAHWELELMVESGLSPMQAIQAATAYAAEFLGADHLGTLQLNKAADFIVLNANPLIDIANTRSIESVYVAGNEVNKQ
jgi:imidazolonepropionase-like amidohydrolase